MDREEVFKGWFHQGLFGAFCVGTAYNGMRWFATREHRNAVNVVLYGALAVYESCQVRLHWSRTP